MKVNEIAVILHNDKSGHFFEKGEYVRVIGVPGDNFKGTKLDEDEYVCEFLDRHDYWFVYDSEIVKYII